jgi:hypothetical protein
MHDSPYTIRRSRLEVQKDFGDSHLGQQDRYGDPGQLMPRPATGKAIQIGDFIYLIGAGASKKG